jgi:tetratricopeptide (TPR) repeat protein
MAKLKGKGENTADKIRFFVAVSCISAISLIGGVFYYEKTGNLVGIILSPAIGLAAAIVVIYVIDRFGGYSAGLFYGGRRNRWTKREQMAGMVSIARNQKMNKNFDEAVITLDSILSKDPDYPEVLFIKAQIYWEAWGNSDTAKKCLRRVLELVPDKNDHINRWAVSLWEELSGKSEAAMDRYNSTVEK